MTTPEQFAIRARAALCERFPAYFPQLPQGDVLQALADAFRQNCNAPVDAIPPRVEDVAAYLKELGSDLDAQDFMDFYTQKGWMVGRVKMKDWRSAARRAHRLWDRPGRKGQPPKSAFFA